MTPPPKMGFAADLEQLGVVAGWRLPQVAILLDFQAQRFDKYEGLSDSSGWSSELNGDFGEMVYTLRRRAIEGADAVRATAEALQDVVALYKRADGQG